MEKSKQHDKRVNPNHIMSHNRKIHDGVYEEDSILERIALGCTLLLLLPLIICIWTGMWLYDVITNFTRK